MAAPDLYEAPSIEEWEMYELFAVARWAGVPAWEFLERPAAFYEGYKSVMEINGMVLADKMSEVRNAPRK
ncbi:MAG TPA: hypothetical protein PKD55_13480 [Bellilinea sp.]|nr:hypothetical protein [Bellilinea sp.]